MVRRHRLIETFLVQRLGYSWDEVHTEAEALEHTVSETFLDRVDADLGHPTHDPHGDPIPAADGTVPASPGTLLAAIETRRLRGRRPVSDDDPALLRYFDELGVGLGTHLRVERVPRLRRGGRRRPAGPAGEESLVDLPSAAAAAIWLAPDERTDRTARAPRPPRARPALAERAVSVTLDDPTRRVLPARRSASGVSAHRRELPGPAAVSRRQTACRRKAPRSVGRDVPAVDQATTTATTRCTMLSTHRPLVSVTTNCTANSATSAIADHGGTAAR